MALNLSHVAWLQLVEEEQELRHRLHLQNLYLDARRLGSQIQEEIGGGEETEIKVEGDRGHDDNNAVALKIEAGI